MSVNVYVQEFRKLEVLTVAMRSNIDSVRLCARNCRAATIHVATGTRKIVAPPYGEVSVMPSSILCPTTYPLIGQMMGINGFD